MSEHKELPNPPGGSITCADGQFCVVESDSNGRIYASCHNISNPTDGMGDGGGGGAPFGGIAELAYEENVLEYSEAIDEFNTIRVGDRSIKRDQMDKGLQIVTGISKSFGGLDSEDALQVVAQEYYERPDGRKVWFAFPVHEVEKEKQRQKTDEVKFRTREE